MPPSAATSKPESRRQRWQARSRNASRALSQRVVLEWPPVSGVSGSGDTSPSDNSVKTWIVRRRPTPRRSSASFAVAAGDQRLGRRHSSSSPALHRRGAVKLNAFGDPRGSTPGYGSANVVVRQTTCRRRPVPCPAALIQCQRANVALRRCRPEFLPGFRVSVATTFSCRPRRANLPRGQIHPILPSTPTPDRGDGTRQWPGVDNLPAVE